MDFDLEDILEKRLKHVNDWLQFAEKKNATLIALNIGIIWGLSRSLDKYDVAGMTNLVLISVGVVLLIASIFVCVYSFLPVLKKDWITHETEASLNDNSLYFGDIAKYSSDEYLKLLKQRYEIKNYKLIHAHKDYSEQIVVNSKIAKHKFDMFSIAAWLACLGSLVLILFVVIFFFKG